MYVSLIRSSEPFKKIKIRMLTCIRKYFFRWRTAMLKGSKGVNTFVAFKLKVSTGSDIRLDTIRYFLCSFLISLSLLSYLSK